MRREIEKDRDFPRPRNRGYIHIIPYKGLDGETKKQMSFLRDVDGEKIKAVEAALEKYRMPMLTVSDEILPRVTQTCSLVPPSSIPVLDNSKGYNTKLVWRKRGYKHVALGMDDLQPKKTHAYFYYDKELKRLGGCFPLHWFTEFREVDADEKGRIYNDPPYKTFKWILEISSHQSHQRNNYIQQ
ncbi:hypothetical protein GTNG_2046 [Geobacillus thermodenitrificans NG80-2]|jgi:hypothetical protein|uniref:Uncharacterized protein n=2 Tax=Anoxybacillaceae TaxID=3120669 RepID=A4IPZ4_GEOTN|nr:hypothetical protein GTNG_2046 [Geobacillus thermodenitrificans NG80-2]